MAVVLSENRLKQDFASKSKILSNDMNITFVVLLTTNWFQRCRKFEEGV